MRKYHSSKCVSLPIYAVYVRRGAEFQWIGNVVNNSNPEAAILFYIMQLHGFPEFKNTALKDVYYRVAGRRHFRRGYQEDILYCDEEQDINFKSIVSHGDK